MGYGCTSSSRIERKLLTVGPQEGGSCEGRVVIFKGFGLLILDRRRQQRSDALGILIIFYL
jgi:hypothetical protein